MVDRTDRLMNADTPLVQDSETPNHVELVLPEQGVVAELHESVFMSLFHDGMRIITGEAADDYK